MVEPHVTAPACTSCVRRRRPGQGLRWGKIRGRHDHRRRHATTGGSLLPRPTAKLGVTGKAARAAAVARLLSTT